MKKLILFLISIISIINSGSCSRLSQLLEVGDTMTSGLSSASSRDHSSDEEFSIQFESDDDSDRKHFISNNIILERDTMPLIVHNHYTYSRKDITIFLARLVGILEQEGSTQILPTRTEIKNMDDEEITYEWTRLASLASQYGYLADGFATEHADIAGPEDNRARSEIACCYKANIVTSNLQHAVNLVVVVAGGLTSYFSSNPDVAFYLGVSIAASSILAEVLKVSEKETLHKKEIGEQKLKASIDHYNRRISGPSLKSPSR